MSILSTVTQKLRIFIRIYDYLKHQGGTRRIAWFKAVKSCLTAPVIPTGRRVEIQKVITYGIEQC